MNLYAQLVNSNGEVLREIRKWLIEMIARPSVDDEKTKILP